MLISQVLHQHVPFFSQLLQLPDEMSVCEKHHTEAQRSISVLLFIYKAACKSSMKCSCCLY